jgi:hypothetical protein
MPNNPETALQELRQRIATAGLPKLSAEALRSYKRLERHGPKLAQPTTPKLPLSLCFRSACRRRRFGGSTRKLIPNGHSGTGHSLRPRSMTTHD